MDYKLYFKDRVGHIEKSLDLHCADDARAIYLAGGRSDGHAMELWHYDRVVRCFPAQDPVQKRLTLVQ